MAMLCALSATAAAWTAPHHAALRARPPMMAMSRTEEIMKSLPEERQSGGAGGQSTYEGLLRLDAGWEALRSGSPPKAVRKIVVEEPNSAAATPEFDVVVCGGTIGVIVAAALQAKGLKVALVEAGKLCGRNQDWNASRKEVLELVELGVITKEDLERVIGIEFNPMRCGFPGGDDVWLADVLNVGVRPDELVGAARRSLEANGGSVFEESPLEAVAVRPGAAVLRLGSSRSSEDGATKTEIRTKLVLDCMGQRSPIVAQVREGQRPDGVCVVVGSCARGYDADANSFGDVIFADTLTEPAGGSGCPTQYFWEAFPASSGPADRTTYLFAYMDLDPQRPSVTDIMEDYWRLLPGYQGVTIDELELQRVLYGLFVSYKDSPLPTKFDRVLQVGDASGIQSPLSFGGFGAITRHLGRLTTAIPAALAADALTASELSLINLYQPNLRAAWLFQATMRPPIGADGGMVWRDTFIGAVLAGTFDVMEKEGESVMKPFLQDVLRVDGLILTIGGLMVRKPLVTAQILTSVGPGAILDWFVHFSAMCAYSALHAGATSLELSSAESGVLPERALYGLQRRAEAWQYGSGLDYVAEPSAPVPPEALARAKAGAEATRSRAADVARRTAASVV